MTKRFLDTNHVEYREINLDEQPEFIDHVKDLGFNAAPVIQTATEAFSGFQPGKFKRQIIRANCSSYAHRGRFFCKADIFPLANYLIYIEKEKHGTQTFRGCDILPTQQRNQPSS